MKSHQLVKRVVSTEGVALARKLAKNLPRRDGLHVLESEGGGDSALLDAPPPLRGEGDGRALKRACSFSVVHRCERPGVLGVSAAASAGQRRSSRRQKATTRTAPTAVLRRVRAWLGGIYVMATRMPFSSRHSPSFPQIIGHAYTSCPNMALRHDQWG